MGIVLPLFDGLKRKMQFQALQDSYEKYVDRQTAKSAQKIL